MYLFIGLSLFFSSFLFFDSLFFSLILSFFCVCVCLCDVVSALFGDFFFCFLPNPHDSIAWLANASQQVALELLIAMEVLLSSSLGPFTLVLFPPKPPTVH